MQTTSSMLSAVHVQKYLDNVQEIFPRSHRLGVCEAGGPTRFVFGKNGLLNSPPSGCVLVLPVVYTHGMYKIQLVPASAKRVDIYIVHTNIAAFDSELFDAQGGRG